MLGVNEIRKPVGEPFASQMRESLLRVQTRNLNEKEKKQLQKDQVARSRYTIIWK